MPVLSIADTVIGMVWLRDISEWIGQGVDPMTPAGQLADHDVPTVLIEDDLESVVAAAGGRYRQMPVVDAFGRLLGLLDLDCLVHRGRLPQEPDSCDSESPRLNVLS